MPVSSDDAGDGGRVGGIGMQVAVAQIGGGEERRAARHVEHEVAARHRAVARGAEAQRIARRRDRLGVIVDGKLESAEMALGGAYHAADHGKIGHARRRHRGEGLRGVQRPADAQLGLQPRPRGRGRGR